MMERNIFQNLNVPIDEDDEGNISDKDEISDEDECVPP